MPERKAERRRCTGVLGMVYIQSCAVGHSPQGSALAQKERFCSHQPVAVGTQEASGPGTGAKPNCKKRPVSADGKLAYRARFRWSVFYQTAGQPNDTP